MTCHQGGWGGCGAPGLTSLRGLGSRNRHPGTVTVHRTVDDAVAASWSFPL